MTNTSTLTLEPTGDTVTQFVQRLADRGPQQGFTTVQLPGHDSSLNVDDFIPTEEPFLGDSDFFKRLHLLSTQPGPNFIYLNGLEHSNNPIYALAEYLDRPLFTISGEYASAEDVFGHYQITDDTVEYIPSTLSTALKQTTNSQVLVYLADFNRLNPTIRKAIITLLQGTDTIEFKFSDTQTIAADLSNLTVFFSDAASSTHQVSSPDEFHEPMDAVLDVSLKDLYNPDLEISYLTEELSIPEQTVEAFVIAVEKLRYHGHDSIARPIPTRAIRKCLETSKIYADADIENPAQEAADSVLVNQYYRTDERKGNVWKIIQYHLDSDLDY